jgi:hypothetical protein
MDPCYDALSYMLFLTLGLSSFHFQDLLEFGALSLEDELHLLETGGSTDDNIK